MRASVLRRHEITGDAHHFSDDLHLCDKHDEILHHVFDGIRHLQGWYGVVLIEVQSPRSWRLVRCAAFRVGQSDVFRFEAARSSNIEAPVSVSDHEAPAYAKKRCIPHSVVYEGAPEDRAPNFCFFSRNGAIVNIDLGVDVQSEICSQSNSHTWRLVSAYRDGFSTHHSPL